MALFTCRTFSSFSSKPFKIFKKFITAIFRQFKVIRHHDCFRRTDLRTKITKNTNFKIDIIRINDFPFFCWVRMFFSRQLNTICRTNIRALITDNTFFRIKFLNSPKTIRQRQRLIRIIIGHFFPCQVFQCIPKPFTTQAFNHLSNIFTSCGNSSLLLLRHIPIGV